MLDLALSQIYTSVFHFWKSVTLDNALDGDSRSFIFFSLACFLAFRDAPHSQFWCRDLKLYIFTEFLKMIHLALSQIYTRVFHLWKSVDFNNAWAKDSRPFISFFSLACFYAFSDTADLRFWCGNPKLCSRSFLKILVLALPQIYSCVFNL